MHVRLVVAGAAVILVAACGGGPAPSGSGSMTTSPAGSTAAPPTSSAPASAPASAGAAIDLSQIDLCTVIPAGTAEALTGETGFITDGSSSASRAHCFWGVPRPGVGQYLEVEISRRTKTLQGYGITFNGVSCPGVTVPGVGTEAVGAVCPGTQTKVWLAAMDKGMMVQVLVNEPTAGLTPAGLADAVKGVLAGLT